MGYLPIILALSCFVFLWGIVNYNSIKRRKKEAEESASLLFKYASLRNTILKQMNQVPDVDPTIHTVIAQIQLHLNDLPEGEVSVQKKIEAEQEVTGLISHIPAVAPDHQQYHSVYKQLAVADDNYRKAVTLYRIRVRQYNELVSKNPSKLVAKVMGLKPIETIS